MRFLLGELPEEERARVEQRLLSDNDFFEEVLSAEDDLIDQYLLGKLSGDRRERAEALFHSSQRQRDEVEFTKDLIASLREEEPHGKLAQPVGAAAPAGAVSEGDAGREPARARPGPKNSRYILSLFTSSVRGMFPRLALVAVSLVCLSLLAFVVYRYSQKRVPREESVTARQGNQEPGQARPEENRNEAGPGRQATVEKGTQENAAELAAQEPARKPKRITSILLAPGTPERSGGPKTPVFKIDARQIRLQLALDKGWRHSQFSVLITTFDGRRVWSQDSLAANQIKGGRLTLLLPSSLFETEDYRVELKGLSDEGVFVHVADYIFKVRK